METYTYQHFPERLSSVSITLFTSVKNSALLRNRIIEASTLAGPEGEEERDALNFAFIDAKLISSRHHLQAAVYLSMLADAQGSLKTKTVHSEILWFLNPTQNISDALRRFGISESSSSIFVVRIGWHHQPKTIESKMKAVVDGTIIPLSAVSCITDWESVKKCYRLDSDKTIIYTQDNADKQKEQVDALVTGLVAMKLVMA